MQDSDKPTEKQQPAEVELAYRPIFTNPWDHQDSLSVDWSRPSGFTD